MIRLREFCQDDAAWLTDQHVRHYTESDGFDASFGELVAQVLENFLLTKDAAHDCGWIAEGPSGRLGSLFLVRDTPEIAKLRLFFVVQSVRGTGLGRFLFETAEAFARRAGYKKIRVFTHESHRAAGRLYAAQGFLMTDTRPAQSFGRPMIVETWEKTLLGA